MFFEHNRLEIYNRKKSGKFTNVEINTFLNNQWVNNDHQRNQKIFWDEQEWRYNIQKLG